MDGYSREEYSWPGEQPTQMLGGGAPGVSQSREEINVPRAEWEIILFELII